MMKQHYLILTLSFFLLAACAQYQVLSFANQQNEILTDGIYTFENDSIKFVYKLHGQNTLVALELENKTKDPIFIDWRHSGLVYNGKSVKLHEDKISSTTIVTQSPPVLLGNQREIHRESTFHNLNSNMLLPTAKLQKDTLVILRARVIDSKELSNSSTVNNELDLTKNRAYSFEQNVSPMKFQFFFTIRFGLKQDVVQSYTHAFYLKSIQETASKPRASQSYIVK